MERPVFKPTGTPVQDLDTPALVVDVDTLERNLETVHSFFRQRDSKLRPRMEAHRCPAIAHKQLAAGGTVGGICVSTLGQAEVFAEAGFRDIFLFAPVVTAQKIDRVCALARHAIVAVAADDPANVKDLARAAAAAGVILDVTVAVDCGTNRFGVRPGAPALELAKIIGRTKSLRFLGLAAASASPRFGDASVPAPEPGKVVQILLDTRETLEKAGIGVVRVCAGDTASYDLVGSIAGVTDVLAGAYALLDGRHGALRPELGPAAKVLATVTSSPEADLVILDAGRKAIGTDLGFPSAADFPDYTVLSLSAEHARLQRRTAPRESVPVGTKVWLTPWDIATCANLYDWFHAVRASKLETIWEVSARGQYR